MSYLAEESSSVSHKLAALPTRLFDWRIAADQNTFSYGGDEVELSLWDTTRVFSQSTEKSAEIDAKKRKRGDTLFSGELWRAKNV